MTENDGDTARIIEDSEEVETRVYAKRWYILAVFSILGVLQVKNFFQSKAKFLKIES